MENIMLQDPRKEQIKIVDFGLSNIYTGGNPLKTHCGSPEYAAPELFVVGKRYGPEVDLWSLGVVLYAMATGRLPFQSPRDNQTSSEERRRKLLAQINRGLTLAQKKSIAAMSSEYRNLVNRLLMPTAHKRITIQELCLHPWISHRHKNYSAKMSQTELLALEHNAIIDEIAEATSTERTIIERDILQAKYGETGGMYNIKAHMMRQQGSFHAFRARSWTTSSNSIKLAQAQNIRGTSTARTGCQTRASLGLMQTTSSQNQSNFSSTTQRRALIFHRSSFTPSKQSSAGGGCRGGIWTSKETKPTSYSSTCPVHHDQSTPATPGVHGSTHRTKWENNSDRMHARIVARASNKSTGGFMERPITQPPIPVRFALSRETGSSPNGVRPAIGRSGIMPRRDPVEQWIAEKLKNLEKKDRSYLGDRYRVSSSFQDIEAHCGTQNNRPPPPTIRTISKDIRSDDQPGAMGQGDRVTERFFYRSPGITRPEVRKTRLVLSNGSRTTEKNPRVSSRPVTANEGCKPSPMKNYPTPRVAVRPPNKLRRMENLEQSSASTGRYNSWGTECSKKNIFTGREIHHYQNVLKGISRDFPD